MSYFLHYWRNGSIFTEEFDKLSYAVERAEDLSVEDFGGYTEGIPIEISDLRGRALVDEPFNGIWEPHGNRSRAVYVSRRLHERAVKIVTTTDNSIPGVV